MGPAACRPWQLAEHAVTPEVGSLQCMAMRAKWRVWLPAFRTAPRGQEMRRCHSLGYLAADLEPSVALPQLNAGSPASHVQAQRRAHYRLNPCRRSAARGV